MDKKLKLAVIETRPAQITKDVVELLEKWLKKAQEGKIVALALAAVEPDGSTDTQTSMNDDFHTLNSAVALLSFRMMRDANTREIE